MKYTKFIYLFFALFLTVFFLIQGCSKLEEQLVAPQTIGTHPAGWAQMNSSDFHGKYLINNKWNLTVCKTCHGVNYDGGTSGKTCLNCHPSTPEACDVCHGSPDHSYPPKGLHGETAETYYGVGAHETHLSEDSTRRFSAQVECNECHTPINGFNDPNHIGPNPNGHADITFGNLARTVLHSGDSIPSPNYSYSLNKCSSVYCHGYFTGGNKNVQPQFNDANSVVCGSCHGDPVSGNPNPGYPNNVQPPHLASFTITKCYLCHGGMINNQGVITKKYLHINGVVNY
jgi:predicted CxxxxCH...CXXCH cytochrome family protein